MSSREAILGAARRLFVVSGFRRTTIRAVAFDAGVSAALVIKLFGTKSRLYAEAAQMASPIVELDLPRDRVAHELVRRVVDRQTEGADEPLARIVTTVGDSPDPDGPRADLRRWHSIIADLIGDETLGAAYATTILCELIGFAVGLRVLGLYARAAPDAVLVEGWTSIIQAQVDACAADPANL